MIRSINNIANSASASVQTIPDQDDPTATSWEKAILGLDTIVAEVSKIDPDGADIVCVGGREDQGSRIW